MPLIVGQWFIFSYFFITYVHSFNHIHTVPTFIHRHSLRPLSPFPHRLYAQWETPLCGGELRIELGSALQQAHALPTELRRTLTELRRTLTELRRILAELLRTLLSYAAPQENLL